MQEIAGLTKAIQDARSAYQSAVRRVQADQLLKAVDATEVAPRPLRDYESIRVIGMGKAAMAMAGVLEAQWEEKVAGGYVVVPSGYPSHFPDRLPAPRTIAVLEGGHPIPTEASQRAARRLLRTAADASSEELVVALISGGGSALAADFAGDITLADAQATYQLLLEGGVEIHETNAVRKHISRVGGGRLAQVAAPADVGALVVSDVVGDDVSTIASGPTVPDPTTYTDAIDVLRRHNLWSDAPRSIREHLLSGQRGEHAETLKAGQLNDSRVRTTLIGRVADATEAARSALEKRGYDARVAATDVTGEAREVATRHVRAIEQEDPFTALVWGGETTVTVQGEGRGGRNQELALAAALELESRSRPIVVLSGGTDGIDGPTDAAGAWATPRTAVTARRQGLDPRSYLDANDSYSFFKALGTLLMPGPTHTNVMDIHIALVRSTDQG